MALVTQSATAATIASGISIATDQVAGVDFQRVKIATGDTGTATDVTSDSPLWVTFPATASFNLVISPSTDALLVTPSTQWTVTTTPSSQATVSVIPTTQFSVTTTPSSVMDVAALVSSSTAVRGTVVTIPSSVANVTTTPSSVVNVTTTPSSQITASVTPTSGLTIGLITSTSTLISQFISVVPTTQWTVTTTPSSVANVTTTPSSVVNVTTTPSSVINVTTTPSSQMTVTTTPSTALVVGLSSGTVTLTSGILVLGQVAVGADATNLYVGGTATAPTITTLTAVTSTTGVDLATAVAGKKVALLTGIMHAPTAPAILQFFDTVAPTTIQRIGLAAGATVTLDFCPTGFFTALSSASALAVKLSSAVLGGVYCNFSAIAR